MRQQTEMAVWDYRDGEPSVLRELFDLIVDSFRPRGPSTSKNEWAMPFDPTPSSYKRNFRGRVPK